MNTFRRMQIVGSALALSIVVTQSPLWGDAGKSRDQIGKSSKTAPAKADQAAEDLAKTKFSRPGVVHYKMVDGSHVFGLPIKPILAPLPKRGCDILIMVDTSAGQVGMPLQLSNELASQIIKKAGAEDRFAIWTVNTPAASHKHTAKFVKANSADATQALKALRNEYPAGINDLYKALDQSVELFQKEGRDGPKAILFLGSGRSTYTAHDDADRSKLCQRLIKERVGFFPVPLGPTLDFASLHGFTSGTGGLLVRYPPSDKIENVLKKVQDAVQAPVLYPSEFKIAAKEFYPAKLPPLRGDSATLVVGKFDPAKELAFEIQGDVAGNAVQVKMAEPVLEDEPDNFFLVQMVEQWKKNQDQPALMQADRALAFAQRLNLVARDELLGEAQMALMLDQRVPARKLFEQVRKLDPQDPEAKGGLALIDKLDKGEVTREALKKQLAKQDGQAFLIEKRINQGKANVKFERGQLQNLIAQAARNEKPAGGAEPVPVAPAMDDNALERQQQLKQAVEEQHIGHIVDDALRQARRLLQTDPANAVDLLKRTLAGIRDNTDLREQFRNGLIGRLEPALRNVTVEAVRATQEMEQRLVLLAQAQARLAADTQRNQDQELARERMRRYRNLMNQARFEDAYQESLALRQDFINQGRQVSPAVTAAHEVALLSHNLREVQELTRIRQERFLATMMQVERSHVPFPDEPPIQFPPLATWKRITELRKDRYESSGLTDDDPNTLKKLKELKTKMETSVSLDGFEANTPLKEALGFISERYAITILMDTEAFKADLQIQEPENQPVKLPKMVSVRLDTVLRLLLAQANATFILRRDYIEITTPQRQAAEKTIRVYPVADLVTPIPNSVNQNAVNQTIGNQQRGSMMGMMGMGGAMGMMMMGMGMGMMGMGQAVGMGLMGGGAGMGGGLMGMGGLGMGMNGGGMGGMMGLMMGGGLVQGGGMAGQLGGQFGLQGGDTSPLLIRLITQVVGKPEDWAPLQQNMGGINQGAGGAMGFGLGMGGIGGMMMGIPPPDPNEGSGNPNEAGALGYYSPTRALIVKGTSRVHTRLGGGLLAPRAPAGGAGAGAIRFEPGKKPIQVAAADDHKDKKKDPKTKPTDTPRHVNLFAKKLDAKQIWQDALSKGRHEPGMIIATADYLVERGEYLHAAEFLKANLRTATVVRPWVYEALATTLKLGKGDVADIERAELSAVDLMPSDAGSYVKASKAMADNGRWDRAVAFCKQAAQIAPDAPDSYASCLTYAEKAQDVEAMEWASSNLLKHDWPTQNKAYHLKAEDALTHLKTVLETEKADAAKLARLDVAKQSRARDLVVTLEWKGQADLDLEVEEPIGTVCSFQQRQTPGGGTLLGDNLLDSNRETYVAAEGFSGTYKVKIKRMWGRPQGSSATLEVVLHKGTPQQRILLHEVIVADFEKKSPEREVRLDDGRRTSVAEVSATPAPTAADETREKLASSDQVLNTLRSLADPALSGNGGGVRGGFGDLPPIAARMSPEAARATRLPPPSYQGKAGSVVQTGVDVTFTPVVSADRRVVGVSLNPVFQTLGRNQSTPVTVLNPTIPGAR